MSDGLRVPTAALLVALYREHARALRAFLRARVADESSVEDLCQDVFLAALARGVPPGDAGPWIFAIARNKARTYVRDRKAHGPLGAEVAATEPSPDLGASDAEERARVREAVAALEPELREAVALRYEAELEAPRVALLLDLPVTTVESRLKRARSALALALAGAGARPKQAVPQTTEGVP